jgi:hypothetical protein
MSLEVLESIDYANRTAVSSISTGQLEKFRKIREWVELRNLFAGEVRSMTYEYNTTHDGAVKNDISQHISAYEYAISDLENLIRSDLSAYKTLSMIRAKNGKAVER